MLLDLKDRLAKIISGEIRLEDIDIDNIKFQEMTRTSQFMKTSNMIPTYFRLIFQIFLCNLEYFVYLCMIYSMMENAGLISIIFPFSVFGYALLEEVRPTKYYWDIILKYTIVILFIKFAVNLEVFDSVFTSTFYIDLQSNVKIGFYELDDLGSLFRYMIPEVLILVCLMQLQIYYKLIDLYDRTEIDIESIQMATTRFMNRQNQDSVEQQFKKINADITHKLEVESEMMSMSPFLNIEDSVKTLTLMHDFDTALESAQVKEQQEQQLAYSCEDHIKDFHENPQPKSIFKKIKYFKKIFPTLKIQKPGVDYYLWNTFALTFLIYYIFNNYQTFATVGEYETDSQLFNFYMVCFAFYHIVLMIFERYMNRTNTIEKSKIQEEMVEDQNLVQSDQQSFAVKIVRQNMNDQDLRLQSNKEFFESTQIEKSKTKVSKQQKYKYVLHIFTLVLAHIYIFWFDPITGNIQQFQTAVCEDTNQNCKNFQYNEALRNFYIIYCFYFYFNSCQIRHGFPLEVCASSTLYYETLFPGLLLQLAYMGIPFILEVRCSLDYMFAETSLDWFQFLQLFQYHSDFFLACDGTQGYSKKPLGARSFLEDKIITGYGCTCISLSMLIGPLFLFSDFGVFSMQNPVSQATFSLEIDLIQTLNNTDISDQSTQYTQSFLLYTSDDAQLFTYDEQAFMDAGFNQSITTNSFDPSEVQQVIPSLFSDDAWQVSQSGQQSLDNLVTEFRDQGSTGGDIQLAFKLSYSFLRSESQTYQTAMGSQQRNITMADDSDVVQQLYDILYTTCSSTDPDPSYKTIVIPEFLNNNLNLGSSEDVIDMDIENFDTLSDLTILWSCGNNWGIAESYDTETEEPTTLQFNLFNTVVSTSALQGDSITSIYSLVFVTLGFTIRTLFVYQTDRTYVNECTHPEAILRLCDYIYMKRHEKDLKGEDMGMRMLVEILRQPELLKSITGSSLKGEMDPMHDESHLQPDRNPFKEPHYYERWNDRYLQLDPVTRNPDDDFHKED